LENNTCSKAYWFYSYQCHVNIKLATTVNYVALYILALAVAYDLPEASPDNLLLGDSYEIQCTAYTDEVILNNVTVSWTGPNGTITNDSRLTITPTISNGTSHTSTLHFLYLSETDEGEYSCGLVIFETELNRSKLSTKLKITCKLKYTLCTQPLL